MVIHNKENSASLEPPGELEYPDNINLEIGVDGVSQIAFSNDISRRVAAVGTTSGRVRIYDCDGLKASELYRKRWHKSIYKLQFSPSSQHLFTTSGQSGIKVHDINGQKVWSNLNAHNSSPITALRASEKCIYKLLPEGDDEGNQPDPTKELFAINDLTMSDKSRNYLFAARDDGALVTYNTRKRQHHMTSDTVSFSARSVKVVKDGAKIVVGTDEGVVAMFSWLEFGHLCDRFPVRTRRAQKATLSSASQSAPNALDWPAVEHIAKVDEDIIAVATDDGVISALSILPNRILESVGQHRLAEEDADFLGVATGDCMSIAVSADGNLLASGCPAASDIRFHPVQHLGAIYAEQKALLATPVRQRTTSVKEQTRRVKRQRLVTDVQQEGRRSDFLAGLMVSAPEGEEQPSDASENEPADDGNSDQEESDTSGDDSSFGSFSDSEEDEDDEDSSE